MSAAFCISLVLPAIAGARRGAIAFKPSLLCKELMFILFTKVSKSFMLALPISVIFIDTADLILSFKTSPKSSIVEPPPVLPAFIKSFAPPKEASLSSNSADFLAQDACSCSMAICCCCFWMISDSLLLASDSEFLIVANNKFLFASDLLPSIPFASSIVPTFSTKGSNLFASSGSPVAATSKASSTTGAKAS